MSLGDWGTSIDTEVSVLTFSIISLLMLCLLLSHTLHSQYPWTSKILPEAAISILIGICTGGIIEICFNAVNETSTDDSTDDDNSENNSSVNLIQFDPVTFLVIQLPPIIFNSGYHINRSMFFANFIPIILLAVLGTAISTFVVAAFLNWVIEAGLGVVDFQIGFGELAAFGALISATDPVSTLAVFQQKKVDLQLFYLVFGESVVNDAVGLVLFDTCSKVVTSDGEINALFSFGNLAFIFIASFLLGVFFAVMFALIFRCIDFKHNQLAELSLFIMITYFPFVCAEFCGISGIVTLLFTAMFAQRYVAPNLSERTANEAESAFRMFSHLSETSVFLILGLSVFKLFKTTSFHYLFLTWTLVACVLARAINVYGLSLIYNLIYRKTSDGVVGHNKLRKEELEKIDKMLMEERTGLSIDDENPEISEADMEDPKGLKILEGEEVSEEDEDNQNTVNFTPSTDNGGEDNPDADADNNGIYASTRWKGSGSFGYGSGSNAKDSIVLNVHQIPMKTQHMLVFSGLRGAVAFACASNFPDKNGNRDAILLVTMFVVLISVFVLGSSTSKVLELLEIETDVNDEEYEIVLTEMKIRAVASFDYLLSRICLPEELWEFTARDTLAGFTGSLTDLVGGASSLFSRGTEERASYEGHLHKLGGTEREQAILNWKRNGGSSRTTSKDDADDGLIRGLGERGSERIEGVTSLDGGMDGNGGEKRRSVLFTLSGDGTGGDNDNDLTEKLLVAEENGSGEGREEGKKRNIEGWKEVTEEGKKAGSPSAEGGSASRRGSRRASKKEGGGSKSPIGRKGRRRSLYDYGGGIRRRESAEGDDDVDNELHAGRTRTARSKSSVN
ncbi:hypothetical protein TrLO_g4671 [Triparma laevis f. longispina]|uniref:Sodium/hydrogen exchanger 8 n=1 Tax=Triparma laevis f. longispina TaxID=1714387 RepID=A0A9W7CGY8_9STRA|nr:hypothetical protein TrLO_g4671 [Triparma laevis f. longispina]